MARSIGTAVQRCERTIAEIGAKLALARRFRFFAAALAAIGASSVIGAAFVGKTATVIAGSITLVSNLARLFAGIVILGGNDREVELANVARRLAKSSSAAELTGAMLEALQKTRYDPAEMKALIQNANELFAEMTDALSSAEN